MINFSLNTCWRLIPTGKRWLRNQPPFLFPLRDEQKLLGTMREATPQNVNYKPCYSPYPFRYI